jgi:hypothetical protein
MNDQYDEALAHEEQQRQEYWECEQEALQVCEQEQQEWPEEVF